MMAKVDMYEQKKRFIVNSLYILIIVALIYFVAFYALKYIMPFLVAFVLSAIFQPLIRLMHKGLRLPTKWSAVIIIFIFFSVVFALIGLGGFGIFQFLKNFFNELPKLYFSTIVPFLEAQSNKLSELASNMDPVIVNALKDYLNNLIGSTSDIINTVSLRMVSLISSYAGRLPLLIVSGLITIILTFFIAIDHENIVRFIKNQLPTHVRKTVDEFNHFLINVLKQYGKSYLIIMTITFLELSLGLSIIGVKNALIISFIIAIFDILPVFGTGGIVIPWALFVLIDGKISFGVSLLILYVAITVVRNIIEPRIVGNQVGLHPVLTLLSMYVGTRVLGVLGLFLAPISLAILKSFHDAKKIKLYYEAEDRDDYEYKIAK